MAQEPAGIDDEEALGPMNDSRYGLTASVWTFDLDAVLRLGGGIEAGTWYMNRCDYLDPALAWTGVKDSGRGVILSRLGPETFTRPNYERSLLLMKRIKWGNRCVVVVLLGSPTT